MTSGRDQAIGLFILFPIITTITVGLRIFVRTRVNRGTFGCDDAALLITYIWSQTCGRVSHQLFLHIGHITETQEQIGFLLWVGLASAAIQYPIGSALYTKYDSAKADVCYIISGTVKISVAMVLYRLDSRRIIRAILITDMIICSVWTVVVTLILALGCTGNYMPVPLPVAVCRSTNYAQEASYVIFDVLHVLIPVAILWNVQLSRTLKWSIVALFAVGLLAAVAAIMKLVVYVKMYNHPSFATRHSLDYQTQIWAVTEHGLSLFAASILALKPVYNYLSQSWTRLSSNFSGLVLSGKDSRLSGSSGSRASGTASSSSRTYSKRKNMWRLNSEDKTRDHEISTELGTIDVRNDVEVRTEDNVDQLKHPSYIVDAYNDSQRRLVDQESKEFQDV